MIRNTLIRGVKVNKSEEYRSGYIDACLDFYNDISKVVALAKKKEDK